MNDQQHINSLIEGSDRVEPAVDAQAEAILASYQTVMFNTPELPDFKAIQVKAVEHRNAMKRLHVCQSPLEVSTAKFQETGVKNALIKAIQRVFICDENVAGVAGSKIVGKLVEVDNTAPIGMLSPFNQVSAVYDQRFEINPKAVVNKFEYWYLDLLLRLMSAPAKGDRTGVGTRSTTHEEYKHDLRHSFPQLRSRFLKTENPSKELQWMISGSNNEKDLAALGVPFWSEFADETGNLGPVYGHLWRFWPNGDGTTTDQLAMLQDLLKNDPNSRRMIINCWHPTFIPNSKTDPKENWKEGKQALTPCHYSINVLTQPMDFADRMTWLKEHHPTKLSLLYPVTGSEWVETAEKRMDGWGVPSRYLDLKFIMRSSDTVLGLPANFGFYAHMAIALAKEANMVPRYLCYSGMDVHMYGSHVKGVMDQLTWAKQHPGEVFGKVTQVRYDVPVGTPITEYDWSKFVVLGYNKEEVGPAIRFPIPV